MAWHSPDSSWPASLILSILLFPTGSASAVLPWVFFVLSSSRRCTNNDGSRRGWDKACLGIGVGAGLVYLILRVGKLLFGRERLTLAQEAKIVFSDRALVLPDKEIPYEELFYRKSDAITLEARTVKLGERQYENVPVRLTPASLHIGDEKFDTQNTSAFEATGTEIVLPREAMGMGDVKLMAAIGAFLGWQAVIFSLIISSVIGSLVSFGLIATRRRQWSSRLPYGPYIAAAATVWIFAGKQLLAYFAP